MFGLFTNEVPESTQKFSKIEYLMTCSSPPLLPISSSRSPEASFDPFKTASGSPLPASDKLRGGQATVISLHETGKYILRLDGTRKQLLFEPDLGNHVPAGVWRILHHKNHASFCFADFLGEG